MGPALCDCLPYSQSGPRSRGPLNFLVILVPFSLMYSWCLGWMVFLRAPLWNTVLWWALHSCIRYPSQDAQVLILFIPSFIIFQGKSGFPLCWVLDITCPRLLRGTSAASLPYFPGLTFRNLIQCPKNVPPIQWIISSQSYILPHFIPNVLF